MAVLEPGQSNFPKWDPRMEMAIVMLVARGVVLIIAILIMVAARLAGAAAGVEEVEGCAASPLVDSFPRSLATSQDSGVSLLFHLMNWKMM